MRKLKQATQREKARRAVREKQKEAGLTGNDRPASKPVETGVRNGHSLPPRTASQARPPSHKATLH